MHDTNAEATEMQLAAFRRLSPLERVAMALEASDWLMALARTRVTKTQREPSVDAPPAGAAPNRA